MTFHMPRLLAKKRDGHELTKEEITQFVNGAVDKSITPDQIGAMLMAMYLNGLSIDETIHLTDALKYSGEILNWDSLGKDKAVVVDKHSTGGVGDKVSIPLAPALMACGCKVPMISGRGLGHTGGTLDKLESIRGFDVRIPPPKMAELVGSDLNGCMVGQSATLVPGDRILYATRDVTSTVTSQPLIVASIMSKKIAESPAALVLDVKSGSGAFMDTLEKAESLATALVQVGQALGIKTTAFITEMDCPIGNMTGNALEVAESVDCMQGKGPKDLEELVCLQGGQLLYLTGIAASHSEGIDKIRNSLHDGSTLEKFKEMMLAQGVSSKDAGLMCSDYWQVLAKANETTELKSASSGYVQTVHAMPVAIVAGDLGAGRKTQGDVIDPAVGIELLVQRGDKIEAGQPWVRIHHNTPVSEESIKQLQDAFVVSEESCTLPSRLIKTIGDLQ